MKRYPIIFTAVLLLAVSCVKELGSSDGEQNSNRRITFKAVSYASQTKAGSGTAFTGNDFHVSAWTTGGVLYMDAVMVNKIGSIWETASAYYWPKADKLKFVATHGVKTVSSQEVPWASISGGNTFSTGDVVFHPVSSSKADSLWLYSDRTGEYSYDSGDVPILFKNAVAAVKANVLSRMNDDIIGLETRENGQKGLYRVYDTLATGTVYYVVPFGFTPNGDLPHGGPFDALYPASPYPIKVKLKKPITHIWRIVFTDIKAKKVGNTGSLTMTIDSNGKWTKPANDVWTVAEQLITHKDSVSLYDATLKGDLNGTPIPANLNDFQCPVSEEFLVMPQNLNWSALSSINNPITSISATVEVYNGDTNTDGIFDYRDVFKYWVVKTKSAGKVTDSTLVSTKTEAINAKDKEFYKWYEWDGSGSSVLHNVHITYRDSICPMYRKMGLTVPNIYFAQVLDSLTPHLKYPLNSSIELAKTTTDETSKYWKMNTLTTYNIRITPVTNELLFAPSVTEWTDVGNVNAN